MKDKLSLLSVVKQKLLLKVSTSSHYIIFEKLIIYYYMNSLFIYLQVDFDCNVCMYNYNYQSGLTNMGRGMS